MAMKRLGRLQEPRPQSYNTGLWILPITMRAKEVPTPLTPDCSL